MGPRRHALGLAVAAWLAGGTVWAQTGPEASAGSGGVALKTSPRLAESIAEPTRKSLPMFLQADRLLGRPDLDTILQGHAELRRGDLVIFADQLEYDQPTDLARARGNVRINRAGNVYEGPALEIKVDAFEGFFTSPTYRMLKNGGHGRAERVDFIDDKRSVVRNATFTTCPRSGAPDWVPDWFLSATRIHLDTEEDVGLAEGGVLRFKDVPLLPIPPVSFPLSDKRKSGFLPPTIGLDNLSGLDLTVPYYWDIAPNRDATLSPRIMSRRGLDLGGEFRYLESDYKGQMRGNWMPNDSLRGSSRWGLSMTHEGALHTGLPLLGRLGVNLNLNRVSDDNYWRDFPRAGITLTQRLLPADASFFWGGGPFSATLRTLKWQTLQDTSAPITPPYDRLPQFTLRHASEVAGGLDVALEADYTRFQADVGRTGQPNGQRSVFAAQFSRPWLAPGGFVTPRLQLHASTYQFDSALSDGRRSATRALPTFSLDSGLILERDARYFGRSFRQTLEPRAFYVYTPFRDQSALPNYDSAANDFNFATLYTENAFGGNDRLADNNLLTLGVTSRLLDPDTGAEAARFGLAQRLRFDDQKVTLPGVAPVSERLSDLMLGASVHWAPQWGLDSMLQFNPKTQRLIRSTLGGRYSPGHYRTVSATYRLQRDVSEQLDVGWQWPVNDLWGDSDADSGAAGSGLGAGRWYGVGRLNYSLSDRKLVDAIVGLEYDAGCWLGRVVLERLQRSDTSANQRVLFQLEFSGFTRVGNSPLQTLRQHIPRYQLLREPAPLPSRFSNYD